jgi:hypothetical protein
MIPFLFAYDLTMCTHSGDAGSSLLFTVRPRYAISFSFTRSLPFRIARINNHRHCSISNSDHATASSHPSARGNLQLEPETERSFSTLRAAEEQCTFARSFTSSCSFCSCNLISGDNAALWTIPSLRLIEEN